MLLLSDKLRGQPGRPSVATFQTATHNLASTAAKPTNRQGSTDDLTQRIQGAALHGQGEQPEPEGQLQ
jgi:hypothetical protein